MNPTTTSEHAAEVAALTARIASLESIIRRADAAMLASICPRCQGDNDGELSIDYAEWERLLAEAKVKA